MIKGRMPHSACGPFLLLALAGCSESTKPSSEESRQLDNAAEMLDRANNDLSDIDENAVADPQDGSEDGR